MLFIGFASLSLASLVTDPKPLADVPFELRDLHIYVKAKINGQGPFDLNIDSGGFMCTSSSLTKQLGLKPENKIEVGGAGAGTSFRGYGKVQSVQIGATTIQGLGCMFNDPEPEEKLEAGIGPELLQNYTVYFDYDHLRMKLYQKGQVPNLSNSQDQPIRFFEEKPLMQVAVGGRTGWFMVDTGAGISLIMQRNYWQAKGIDAVLPPQFKVIVGYGVGGPIYGGVGRLPYVRIGQYRLDQIPASYSEMTQGTLANPERDGLLGQRILRHFNQVYDYANQRIILQPSQRFGQKEAYSFTGIVGSFNGKGWGIDEVIPGSTASTAGLQKGDLIVGINGISIKSEADYRKRMGQPEGTKLRLSVERKDAKVTTEIWLKEVL